MPNKTGTTILKKQVAELEVEVERLQKELAMKQKPSSKKVLTFLRKASIVLLVILTALFINLSVVALYVRRNIVNTDVWVSKTTQVIQTPSVRQDISNSLSQTIFEKTDAEQNIKEFLPDRVAPLAGPLTKTLQNFTAQEIDKILASDQFVQFWQNASKSAHSGIIQSLENADSNSQNPPTDTLLYIKDENLYVNLQPILDNIKTRLSDRGLSFVNNINAKQVDKSVPVAHINNFQEILAGFNAMNKAAIVLPLLALISFVGAIVLSVGKRLTLMAIAGTTILLMILNVQAIYLAKYPFINYLTTAAANTSNQSADAFFSIFVSNLILFDRIVMLAALTVITVAYLSGPFKFARWLRKSVANLFKGKMNKNYSNWIAGNIKPILVVSGLVAAALLVFQPVSGVAFSIAVVVLYLLFALIILSFRTDRIKKKK
jgi:hypothetical protein